jgi:hypothetical protein
MVPLSYYLVLSGILFACGVTGFLIKRNIITVFMSIELMLNGVNLSFVAFAAQWHALSGQSVCVLCDGRSGSRSHGRTGHYHRGLPHARDFQRGSDKPAQTMTPNLYLWLIPVLPLAGALPSMVSWASVFRGKTVLARSRSYFRVRHSPWLYGW